MQERDELEKRRRQQSKDGLLEEESPISSKAEEEGGEEEDDDFDWLDVTQGKGIVGQGGSTAPEEGVRMAGGVVSVPKLIVESSEARVVGKCPVSFGP